jgi:predicted transposase YbfD/YdcC
MTILQFAQSLPDHRQEFKILHLSTDIIFITVAAVICGAEDWEDVQYFGEAKEQFFRKHLLLPNGIPSHDTFNRFFSNIDPIVMEQQFRIWVKTVCAHNSTLVSIDGKTICGAKANGKNLFHMVSAFCHANGVSLAQVRSDAKSNEITAIPELIKILDLEGCIVSIDAMGCQQSIADLIIEQKADYLLAVKKNQLELYQAVEDTFRFESMADRKMAHELDFGHGRIEERTCYISSNLTFVNTDKWRNVQTVIKIVCQRYNKTKQQAEEPTTRYYISSLKNDAQAFNSLVRKHWAIENNLHWELDVTMGEDASRKRAKNSPLNFSVVCKTALTMLKKYSPFPQKKRIPSIKSKRKIGGWSHEHLSAMLNVVPE